MDKYIVTGPVVRIHCGLLELTDEQVKHRMRSLEFLGGGIYRVNRTVEFKNSEVFGYDGEMPKAMAEVLEKEQPQVIQEVIQEAEPLSDETLVKNIKAKIRK